MPDSDTVLQAHIDKLRTIHGDEPIRIKLALPWAEELLAVRQKLQRKDNLIKGLMPFLVIALEEMIQEVETGDPNDPVVIETNAILVAFAAALKLKL